MRLLIRLCSSEDSKYEMQYHYHLQGLIYSLLKDSKYEFLHDKEGYKFFCFSNIFPAHDLRRGDLRTLIISSPNIGLIDYMHKALSEQYLHNEVEIGRMKFNIHSLEQRKVLIPPGTPFSLITGTPIISRIPREKYKQYQIKPKWDYDYVYWRSEYPIVLFASQLENNLVHKYMEYSETNMQYSHHKEQLANGDQFTLFQKCLFKKQISTKVLMKGTEQTVIGSIWRFDFEGWENMNLIQFAIDTGLGERNSLGFGFVNLVKTN